MSSKKDRDFPERLAGLMEERGYNASSLARAVGVRRQAVTHWLKGRGPDTQNAAKAAKALGVSVGYLLRGEKTLADVKPAPQDRLRALAHDGGTADLERWVKARFRNPRVAMALIRHMEEIDRTKPRFFPALLAYCKGVVDVLGWIGGEIGGENGGG